MASKSRPKSYFSSTLLPFLHNTAQLLQVSENQVTLLELLPTTAPAHHITVPVLHNTAQLLLNILQVHPNTAPVLLNTVPVLHSTARVHPNTVPVHPNTAPVLHNTVQVRPITAPVRRNTALQLHHLITQVHLNTAQPALDLLATRPKTATPVSRLSHPATAQLHPDTAPCLPATPLLAPTITQLPLKWARITKTRLPLQWITRIQIIALQAQPTAPVMLVKAVILTTITAPLLLSILQGLATIPQLLQLTRIKLKDQPHPITALHRLLTHLVPTFIPPPHPNTARLPPQTLQAVTRPNTPQPAPATIQTTAPLMASLTTAPPARNTARLVPFIPAMIPRKIIAV